MKVIRFCAPQRCRARPAGVPPARLAWFSGDKAVESRIEETEDGAVVAVMTFVPDVSGGKGKKNFTILRGN